MKNFSKKHVWIAVIVMFILQIFTANIYAADYTALVNEVGYVSNYIDSVDFNAINGVKLSLKSVSSGTINDSVTDELMTSEFISKFSNRADAKAKLIKLLGESLSVYFSTSSADMLFSLSNAEANANAIFETAFGSGVSIEKWFDLFLLTKKDAQSIAGYQEKITWATGSIGGSTDSLVGLLSVMDTLQNRTVATRLDRAEYAGLKNGFNAVNWTVEKFVRVLRRFTDAVDSSNVAEFALLKAAARSSAKLTAAGAVIDLTYAGTVLNNNVIHFSPSELPKTITLSLAVMGSDVTNLTGYNASNESVASISPAESENSYTLTVNGTKGTSEIVIKRDPLGDNSASVKDWLVRFKILVSDSIAKVSKPVWGTGANEGIASWTAVDNAHSYGVALYKNGVLVTTKNTSSLSCDLKAETAEPGDYTVTVTAKGSIPEEVSEISDISEKYTVTSSINQVSKPVWVTDTKTINWNGVTGAVKYKVRLYQNDTNTPIDTFEVNAADGVNAYNFAEKLAGKTGSFYVSIQAVGENNLLSEVSVLSDALALYSTISGFVKLEVGNNIVKENNSGIKVSIADSIYQTTTAADGSFSLTGIPDGSYKLRFEKSTYLRGEKVVTVSGGIVNINTVQTYYTLLYGDFDGINGIGPYDLSAIIARVGATQGTALYDERFDIDDNGRIDLIELTIVIKNTGKTLS